jgi:putative transposase
MKKLNFSTGEIFHVFNKSIANYGIFKDLNNSQRFINTLDYYNSGLINESFSKYLKRNDDNYNNCLSLFYPKEFPYLKFLSYCVMPDHYHLLLKILKDGCLSKYISDVENSFTRYFNIKFERKGPLWQTSFKAVRIKSDQQLLHVSRYIHLNPTTSGLVERPEDWKFSSYQDFISNKKILEEMVTEISISHPVEYRKFVEDQKDYQKELKLIQKLILD